MQSLVTLFVFLISTQLIVFTISECQLKWVQSSNGAVVANALNFIEADQLNEQLSSWSYLARSVGLGNDTAHGQISSGQRSAVLRTNSGTLIEVINYEVLTNPDLCLLRWSSDPARLRSSVIIEGIHICRDDNVLKLEVPGFQLISDDNCYSIDKNSQITSTKNFSLLTTIKLRTMFVNSKFVLDSEKIHVRAMMVSQQSVSNEGRGVLTKSLKFSQQIRNTIRMSFDERLSSSREVTVSKSFLSEITTGLSNQLTNSARSNNMLTNSQESSSQLTDSRSTDSTHATSDTENLAETSGLRRNVQMNSNKGSTSDERTELERELRIGNTSVKVDSESVLDSFSKTTSEGSNSGWQSSNSSSQNVDRTNSKSIQINTQDQLGITKTETRHQSENNLESFSKSRQVSDEVDKTKSKSTNDETVDAESDISQSSSRTFQSGSFSAGVTGGIKVGVELSATVSATVGGGSESSNSQSKTSTSSSTFGVRKDLSIRDSSSKSSDVGKSGSSGGSRGGSSSHSTQKVVNNGQSVDDTQVVVSKSQNDKNFGSSSSSQSETSKSESNFKKIDSSATISNETNIADSLNQVRGLSFTNSNGFVLQHGEHETRMFGTNIGSSNSLSDSTKMVSGITNSNSKGQTREVETSDSTSSGDSSSKTKSKTRERVTSLKSSRDIVGEWGFEDTIETLLHWHTTVVAYPEERRVANGQVFQIEHHDITTISRVRITSPNYDINGFEILKQCAMEHMNGILIEIGSDYIILDIESKTYASLIVHSQDVVKSYPLTKFQMVEIDSSVEMMESEKLFDGECDLKWKWVSNGEVLDDAIDFEETSERQNDHKSVYFARTFKNGKLYFGYTTKALGGANLVANDNSTLINEDVFQVLTNPNKCILDFVPARRGEIPRKSVRVCRSKVKLNSKFVLRPGTLRKIGESYKCVSRILENQILANAEYEMLTIVNLETHLEDLVYDFDPSAPSVGGKLLQLSSRELVNTGTTEIVQQMSFTKQVINRVSLRFDESFKFSTKVSIDENLESFYVKFGNRVDHGGHDAMYFLTGSTMVNIDWSSSIEAPPNSRLVIKAYTKIFDDEKIPFRVNARISSSSSSLTGGEILEFLRRLRVTGHIIETGSNYVIIQISGKMTASFALNGFTEVDTYPLIHHDGVTSEHDAFQQETQNTTNPPLEIPLAFSVCLSKGSFRDPMSCSHYWMCSSRGVGWRARCHQGQYYHSLKKICVNVEFSDCS